MARPRCTLTALLAVLSVLAGCHGQQRYARADARPVLDTRGHARSLVMDGEPLHTTTRSADLTEQDAWYLGRYDQVRTVTDGYVSSRYERSITHTRDTRYVSGGRVYDRYQESTHRHSVRESIR